MQAEKFSRYEIKELLGLGGMATVYRAYDPQSERDVALKILKQELLNDPQVRDRFECETKIIARLEHAGIVPVYDIGTDRGQLFFVMRYMPGGSLIERIQKRMLSLNEIAYILQRVAAALDYAHDKGIIHRDVKPGNILFDEYDNAYISDFGIAKFSNATIKLTNSGIIGTPTHMSPEQARGEEVDGRSDIYSLGVILFEMLSGKTPFEATTPLGMAFKHASDPVPHILKINPNLPDTVETVIEKVMAKDRDQRYSTSMEFANDFSATLTEDSKLVVPVPTRVPIQGNERTPPPSTGTRKPVSLFWMVGGFMLLTLAALWGLPRFAASLNPTSQPATVTLASFSPTSAPTEFIAPISTAVQTPVVAFTPIVITVLTIGGADKIALTANKDIFIMDMDGSNIQQLTNTNIPKFDLQWLPGGDEILYVEGNCIYTINVEAAQFNSEQISCFNDEDFDGFRVSPNGEQVAISIGNRLLILPFDLQRISEVGSTFELQSLEDLCLDYAAVSVKGAQWSADGQ